MVPRNFNINTRHLVFNTGTSKCQDTRYIICTKYNVYIQYIIVADV